MEKFSEELSKQIDQNKLGDSVMYYQRTFLNGKIMTEQIDTDVASRSALENLICFNHLQGMSTMRFDNMPK